MLSGKRLIGLLTLFVVLLVIALLTVAAIAATIVAAPETRNGFFGAAMDVSAALVIAVFFVAARVLSGVRDEKARRTQLLFLSANILLVFVGLMIAAFGLLSPGAGMTSLVFSLFLTWLLALFLMLTGLASYREQSSGDLS